MKKTILAFTLTVFFIDVAAQSAEEIVLKVKEKLDKVNDYEASGKMKTNVVFIKAPVAEVKIYFKKPDQLKILNQSGISFIPRGTFHINLNNVFNNMTAYDLIDAGREESSNLRIIKLLPRNENTDVVLSTLYIDEKSFLVKKAKTTTRESGTFELEMTYGRYSDYGLADKILLTFNTKEYKLPKGITFDYDDGSGKKKNNNELKNKKGKVEILYSSYIINKGLSGKLFN